MIVFTCFTVDETHTDYLGHMNHVAAVRMLELARDGWYEEAGLWGGRPWSEGEILGTVVVNIDVSYQRECFLAEQVRIRTRPIDKGKKSFVLEQEIIKPDGQVAVAGRCTSVIMDMVTRQTITVPDSIDAYFCRRH